MGSQAVKNEPTRRPKLDLLLAAPRGFCAGVERAIRIVELALAKFGAPVYVRHEIVHNRYVVERLQKLGAVFIEQIEEVPPGARVIFSAHGVAKSVTVQAEERRLHYVDATCPLVSKVHVEAERHHRAGREIVLIGHAGHPEVEGTLGQLPDGAITLIESKVDAESYEPRCSGRLAYVTQTTLSIDDAHAIVAALRRRFPEIVGPHRDDICYATTNRQDAVKAIACRSDAVFVIGAPNSSNSRRLVEVAARAGARVASLIQRAADIDWTSIAKAHTIGLSAGASAPECLIDEVVAAFRERYEVHLEEIALRHEDISFNVPRALAP
jgi:4-hydroxy-3-methylbut-2-enyl diphosphate reductase